jgi:central kinetochore subunit Mis15/CHL4
MPRLSVPTKARLPSSLRLEASNAAVVKLLNRLSRPSLLSLVLDWLADSNQSLCPPLLRPRAYDDDEDDGDDFYPPARSLDDLRELYSNMQTAKGSKRDVVDRIVEGDWRHGLTLYQLAMADLQYLYDHPGSIKWTAYKVQRLKMPSGEEDAEGAATVDRESLVIPRFHPSTFLQNLQAEVLPDVKAHYNFDRPKDLPLLLLRIFILDSPYNTGLAVSASSRVTAGAVAAATTATFDASRTLYIAFPDASPHIYISRSQTTGATTTGDSRSLRSLIVEGIPKALSRPRERYGLRPTHLASKNLEGLLQVRGAGRGNAAGGGWAIYHASDEANRREDSPLNPVLPRRPLAEIANPSAAPENAGGAEKRKRERPAKGSNKRPKTETPAARDAKRRKVAAQARFGDSARIDDGKGVERLDILLEDPFPNARGPNPGSADPAGKRTKKNNNDKNGEDNDNNNNNNNDEEEDSDASGRRRSMRLRRSKGRRSGVHLELELAKADAEAEGDGSDKEDAGNAANDNNNSSSTWTPSIRLAFSGPHVFAGLRQLVEVGVIDGARMPGWMTGEEGVTVGAVRHGRIRGHQGSGL